MKCINKIVDFGKSKMISLMNAMTKNSDLNNDQINI
jgi:hypothetical protein